MITGWNPTHSAPALHLRPVARTGSLKGSIRLYYAYNKLHFLDMLRPLTPSVMLEVNFSTSRAARSCGVSCETATTSAPSEDSEDEARDPGSAAAGAVVVLFFSCLPNRIMMEPPLVVKHDAILAMPWRGAKRIAGRCG